MEAGLCLTDKGYLCMGVSCNHAGKNPVADIHWITKKVLLHQLGTPRSEVEKLESNP